MMRIKSLLLPLGICIASLLPSYEMWCIDEDWRDALDDALSYSSISDSSRSGIASNECRCSACWVVAPGDDDESDDD
jgi:hypothetical protein